MPDKCTLINQLGRDVYYQTREGNLIFFAWGSSLEIDTGVAFTLNVPNRWISPYLTVPGDFSTVYVVRGESPNGVTTPETDFGVEATDGSDRVLVDRGAISYVRHVRPRFQTDGPRRIACEDGLRVEVNIEDQADVGAGFIRVMAPGTAPGTECELIEDLSWWAKILILALVLTATVLIVASSVYIFQR